jgi:hypothetical protein
MEVLIEIERRSLRDMAPGLWTKGQRRDGAREMIPGRRLIRAWIS